MLAPKPRNRLLAALSPAEFEALRPHLEPAALAPGKLLSAAGEHITHAFFPEDGLISLVQPLADGAAIEVALIGREGFVGSPVLLGAHSDPSEATAQLSTTALKITTKALLEAADANQRLRSLLFRYTHALHIEVAQTAACNARHNLRQRLARWLLSARDRTGSDSLTFSHESLSAQLGLRRAGVTIAMGELRVLGLIENSHGSIRIADPAALEHTACECYRLVRDEYHSLLS